MKNRKKKATLLFIVATTIMVSACSPREPKSEINIVNNVVQNENSEKNTAADTKKSREEEVIDSTTDDNNSKDQSDIDVAKGSFRSVERKTIDPLENDPEAEDSKKEEKRSGRPASKPSYGCDLSERYSLLEGQKIEVEILVDKLDDDDILESVRADVKTPNSKIYPMEKGDDGLSCVFFAPKDGIYSVNVYYLNERGCSITVSEILG